MSLRLRKSQAAPLEGLGRQRHVLLAALQPVAERAENALSSSWRVAVGRFRALYNDVFIVSKMSIQAQPKHMDGLRCGGKFATPFQQPCTKRPS